MTDTDARRYQLCQLCPSSSLLLRPVSRASSPVSRSLRPRGPSAPSSSSRPRTSISAASKYPQEARPPELHLQRAFPSTPQCTPRHSHSLLPANALVRAPLALSAHQQKPGRQGHRRASRVHRQAQGVERTVPQLDASRRARVPQLPAQSGHGGHGGGRAQARVGCERDRQIRGRL